MDPWGGKGIAMEMRGAFTFAIVPAFGEGEGGGGGGNTRDLCYLGKKGSAMKT